MIPQYSIYPNETYEVNLNFDNNLTSWKETKSSNVSSTQLNEIENNLLGDECII